MAIHSINPATGETVKEYPVMEAGECMAILEKTAAAYPHWRNRPLDERIQCVLRLAGLLSFVNRKVIAKP